MERPSFTCDCCGERIEDGACPIVIRVTIGLAPMHPDVVAGNGLLDVTDRTMTELARELLAKPVARGEWCDGCFAERFGLVRSGPPAEPA